MRQLTNGLTSEVLTGRTVAGGRLTAAFLVGVGLAAGPVFAQQSSEEKPKATPRTTETRLLTPPAVEKSATPAVKPSTSKTTPTLEEVLTQALKANADIRVAESKLHEAEAELTRARVQVTQKVVSAYRTVERARALANYREKQYNRFKQLADDKAVDLQLVDERWEQLSAAKAELDRAEVELSSVLGWQSSKLLELPVRWQATDVLHEARLADVQGLVGDAKPGRAVTETVAASIENKIRKALDTPVTVDFKHVSLSEILKGFEKSYGIPFVLFADKRVNPEVSLRLDAPVPLGAALQALEDFLPPVRFVIRDYGVLVTTGDRVPDEAATVQRFWKQPIVKFVPTAPKTFTETFKRD